MRFYPGLGWKSVYILSDGDSAHHKKPKTRSLWKADGTLTQNDEEEAEIWDPHFTKVFNNKRDVNWKVLEELSQFDTEHVLDSNLTYSEFEKALDGLANGKLPGENNVSPDVIKALKEDNRLWLYHWIIEFWEGRQDYESWHSGLLVIIQKAGKAKDDPNNYRGVNFVMDIISKVLLSRILNDRLLQILD